MCIAEFEMKRRRALKYDELKSGMGYDLHAFHPKEAFAELLESVEEALDGVMDLGDLRLFSVTLTSHRDRTGGLDPLSSDKVGNASSVSQVFRKLRPYWSWDDFNILEKIVDISNCPKAQFLIQEFLKKRRKFLGEDIKPAPITHRSARDNVVARLSEERNAANPQYEVLRTIIFTELGILPRDQLLRLRKGLMEMFSLSDHQIHFAGHMHSEAESLLWLVPEEDVQRILPLVYTKRSKLRELEIVRVEVGKNISYNVRDENCSYNDSKTSPEVQQFRVSVADMLYPSWSHGPIGLEGIGECSQTAVACVQVQGNLSTVDTMGTSWLSCIQWNLSIEDTIGTQLTVLCTVEPLYSEHHWDPAGCPV